MKLVEAEAEGPVEGEDPVVTPPRPPHRRVSVSFLFTLTVLVGTVVAIYMAFPARHNVLLTAALEQHREPGDTWELTKPSSAELRGWTTAVVGRDAPLPAFTDGSIVGARQIEVLRRKAAVVRGTVGGEQVTYVVQRTRGLSPDHAEETSDELRAIAWRRGKFLCAAVGPSATAKTWLAGVR